MYVLLFWIIKISNKRCPHRWISNSNIRYNDTIQVSAPKPQLVLQKPKIWLWTEVPSTIHIVYTSTILREGVGKYTKQNSHDFRRNTKQVEWRLITRYSLSLKHFKQEQASVHEGEHRLLSDPFMSKDFSMSGGRDKIKQPKTPTQPNGNNSSSIRHRAFLGSNLAVPSVGTCHILNLWQIFLQAWTEAGIRAAGC